MPQIIFKGIDESVVEKISQSLPQNLSVLTNIQEDWFTIEYLPVKFYSMGKQANGYPVVNVNWFDRGYELQDKVAIEITKAVQNEGYDMVDVIFNNIERRNYYENGKHF